MRMALLLVLLCAACGGGEEATSAGSGGGGPASSSAGGGFDPSGGGGGYVISDVFGHSHRQLYRLEPETKEVTVVGSFVGCGDEVIDIAIDRLNRIVASTFDGLYWVHRDTAECTLIAPGNYPNSLSYVPVGTLDDEEEALVGYEGGVYRRIDPDTGTVTTIGGLGGGPAAGLSSSGDLVSVAGGGTYLTATGAGCDDCLVEIDPVTGSVVRNFGNLGIGDVFGLAYWGGRAYGFGNQGELFEINFVGDSLETVPIPIPQAPNSLRFWGAGSSTNVPLDDPR